MYRQAIIMEAEQQQHDQILTKLGELPIVSDTCAQVLDIYERTKGHNFLFRTYFGLAEYTARAVAGKAVPVIYNGLKSPIDKVNDMACTQLDALEERYPILTKPTQEVLREGQEQYDKVRPIVDPLVVKPAMAALDIGKTAVTTAVAPAKYAVHMGSAAIDSGKQAASQVASSVLARGQQVVDAGLTTPLGQFWVQQFDSALDATEKLVLNRYLPLDQGQADGEEKKKEAEEEEEKEDVGEEEEEGGSRRERVCALVKHLHTALYHKAEGDIVRYRMMAGNLLHEINQITTFYVTLMKDGADTAWRDRQDVVAAADRLWSKYAHFIPEAARPEDPVKRVVVVLSTLTGRLGELFTASSELTTVVNSHLSDKCQQFVQWCQQSSVIVKERVLGGGETVREWYADYMTQLSSYLPHIMEMVHFLSDKALNTLDTLDVFALDVPVTLSGSELSDVGMTCCQGMGVAPGPRVINCVS